MFKITLILIYKAMMYVAEEEGIELDSKHEELIDKIIQDYDNLDVTDMVDNLDIVYNLIENTERNSLACVSLSDEMRENIQTYANSKGIYCKSEKDFQQILEEMTAFAGNYM